MREGALGRVGPGEARCARLGPGHVWRASRVVNGVRREASPRFRSGRVGAARSAAPLGTTNRSGTAASSYGMGPKRS